MRTILFSSVLALLPVLPAQDILHFKFDGGCGSEAINFAPGGSNGAITTTAPGGVAVARISGRYVTALGGSGSAYGNTWMDTGWAPGTSTGNYSFAMWIRNRPQTGSIGFGYLFGATGSGASFRLFTGSSGKLFLSDNGYSATSVNDLTALLNAGWVHVACVVDGNNLSATWYINGVADPAVTLSGPVAPSGTDFTIGARSTSGSSPSPLDTDEFRLTDQLWTPAEVLAMATGTRPMAADADYDLGVPAQCGAGNVTLSSGGGAPAIGNANYTLEVSATSPSIVVLVAGFNRCQFGGVVPLPLDLTPLVAFLPGCFLVTDAPVAVNGVAVGTPAVFPLAIPANAPTGTIYAQALGLDLTTSASSMSDGFAIAIGG